MSPASNFESLPRDRRERMRLSSYFIDFLKAVRPEKEDLEEFAEAHKKLRELLSQDEDLKEIIIATFLQGSYRRATAIRPTGGGKGDVDVVVVTNLDRTKLTPTQALNKFKPFLEKHYRDKYKIQGRSIGIELGRIKMDLVVTSAPPESEKSAYTWLSVRGCETPEDVDDWGVSQDWLPPALRRAGTGSTSNNWKLEPLYIPDRDAKEWKRTHPLEQMRWTWQKNANTNKHYVNVVKALKWWRKDFTSPKHPKGYPVEHLLGAVCPDGIEYVADGVVDCLEKIVAHYGGYAASKTVPKMPDHGVPEHDVFARITGEDFAAFYEKVKEAAVLARQALEADDRKTSARLWAQLFGDEFPHDEEDDDDKGGGPGGGYTPRVESSRVSGGRFA